MTMWRITGIAAMRWTFIPRSCASFRICRGSGSRAAVTPLFHRHICGLRPLYVYTQLTRATASLTHLLLIRLSHGDPKIDRIGQIFAPQIRLIKGQALANLSAS